MESSRVHKPFMEIIRNKLGKSFLLWKLYHFILASPASVLDLVHKPIVLRYLNKNLGTVCDLGCGSGRYTRFLVRRSNFVVNVDVDKLALERTHARNRAFGNLSFVNANLEQLPFRLERFDTLLFIEILEHLEDDLNSLMELASILKPNGRLILSVPVPPGYIDNPIKNPYGHKREGYILVQLISLLEKSGFKLIAYEYCTLIFSRFVIWFIGKFRKLFKVSPPYPVSWIACFDYFIPKKYREKCSPANLILEVLRK